MSLMKTMSYICTQIMSMEQDLSIEELVNIKEFIDSIIVLRTRYLSEGSLSSEKKAETSPDTARGGSNRT